MNQLKCCHVLRQTLHDHKRYSFHVISTYDRHANADFARNYNIEGMRAHGVICISLVSLWNE